ncbi:MAG: hypothetical protein ABIB97_05425 [Patescibacteria group bacterium]
MPERIENPQKAESVARSAKKERDEIAEIEKEHNLPDKSDGVVVDYLRQAFGGPRYDTGRGISEEEAKINDLERRAEIQENREAASWEIAKRFSLEEIRDAQGKMQARADDKLKEDWAGNFFLTLTRALEIKKEEAQKESKSE